MSAKVLANRGGPANPLSEAELTTKFVGNAQRSISGDARALAAAAWDLAAGGTPAELLGKINTFLSAEQ
jgi:hypothetical protein